MKTVDIVRFSPIGLPPPKRRMNRFAAAVAHPELYVMSSHATLPNAERLPRRIPLLEQRRFGGQSGAEADRHAGSSDARLLQSVEDEQQGR